MNRIGEFRMLRELKEELFEIAIKSEKDGLCRHKSGNFSARDEKTGYVVITPTGMKRQGANYESIVVVDMKGNVIESNLDLKPTSEILMHLKAYSCRQDIKAVCHSHSIYATTFAVMSKEIQPVVFEAVAYGGTVPVAKYARPGSSELAESIAEPLTKSNACLLEKHGVLTVGKSLEEAYLNMGYVEDVARIYFYSLMIGGKEPSIVPIEDLKF